MNNKILSQCRVCDYKNAEDNVFVLSILLISVSSVETVSLIEMSWIKKLLGNYAENP